MSRDLKSSKTDSLTDRDLDKIANLLDNQLTPLPTKDFVKEEIKGVKSELKETEKSLKKYIDEGVETIIIGIDNIF